MFRNLRMLRLGGALLLLTATSNGSSIRSGSASASGEDNDSGPPTERGTDIEHPNRHPVLHTDASQAAELGQVCIDVLEQKEDDDKPLELESTPEHKAKGVCATIFSCDSWKKMIWPSEETPTYLRRFISILTAGLLSVGVLVPYIRHHVLGMMNAQLVETISGTLATHQVWSKTWGTIGSCFGALAFYNLWKNDVADIRNNETSGCDKALTYCSLTSLSLGAAAQLGVLWLPIGGRLSSWHKYAAALFFVPTAIGVILYAWITARKTGFSKGGICRGGTWRTWLYVFLTFCVAIFAFSAPVIEGQKNQMKMTIPDCVLENPDNTDICTAEINILPMDSEFGNCRPERPNYRVPMKKKYECDYNPDVGTFDLKDYKTLDEAKEVCEGALFRKSGQPDEKCFLTQTQLGGWMKNIGECKHQDKDLQGPTDPCRDASARNSDGKIDNKAFEDNCAAVDGNVCDYTPASKSETFWRLFSTAEMVSFSSALVMIGLILTGTFGAVSA